MNKIIMLAMILAIVSGSSIQANAGLSLLGQGTSSHGKYNLIYDSDLDITWYDYTNTSNTWVSQLAWAEALSVDFGETIYNDWRLPSTVDGPYNYGYTGTTTAGYNITSSEMGHLFYTGLGNIGKYDTYGDPTSCSGGSCLTSTGYFQNLQSTYYWSDTEYSVNPGSAWYFNFNGGAQGLGNKTSGYKAFAVYSGLAGETPVVPEPVSSILFLTGGMLLGFRRLRKRVSG